MQVQVQTSGFKLRAGRHRSRASRRTAPSAWVARHRGPLVVSVSVSVGVGDRGCGSGCGCRGGEHARVIIAGPEGHELVAQVWLRVRVRKRKRVRVGLAAVAEGRARQAEAVAWVVGPRTRA